MNFLVLTLVATVFLLGCGGVDSRSGTQTESASQMAAGVGEVVAAYEVVRGRLAGDEVQGLAAAFGGLESAASGAPAEFLSATAKDRMRRLQDAAARGAKLESDDLEGARTAFSEASEHLVAVIASDPSLGVGLHLFECPMVQGYPKWVQTSDSIGNPYLGKQMPSCGVESQWTE